MDYAKCSTLELLQSVIGVRSAKRVYQGSLTPLFTEMHLGTRHHRTLAAARELVHRWLAEDLRSRVVFQNPALVREYLRLFFAGRHAESFVVLFVDSQNRLIVAEEMFRGTLAQTSVYPREVVKAALGHNAAGVIFSHNHPSGVAEPSRADELLTQALKQALSLIDVRVLDHFVVAGSAIVSFAERGLV